MIVVSEESIMKALKRVEKADKLVVDQFVKDLTQRQPFVMTYAYAMSELSGDKNSEQELFYYTVIIWQSYLIEARKMPKVSDRVIMKIEDQQIHDFGDIVNLNDIQAALKILKGTRQPNLVAFLSTELTKDENMNYQIQSQFFSTLKVIIEAFDETVNGGKDK